MAIEMSYKFKKHLLTETVQLKSGETQENYIRGIHANLYCTDSDTGESVSRSSVIWLTDPSEKNKSDFTPLEDLSKVPDIAKTKAEEVIADSTLSDQMKNDLQEKKKEQKTNNAVTLGWSDDFVQ